jgi:hypothetical protein
MSGDLDLEQRYRRVLRLLPGYYRDKREEDIVAELLILAAAAALVAPDAARARTATPAPFPRPHPGYPG